MKKIFVFVLFLMALYGTNSYGEDITVSDYIYCDGSTLTLQEAVSQADEGDNIYITNDMTINSPALINKSLKIQSLGQEKYSITVGGGTDEVFILSHPSSFVLENIHIKSYTFTKSALIGQADAIIILNCDFEKSHIALDEGSGIITEIKDSRFLDSKLAVRPNIGNNNLALYNNNFMAVDRQFESIILKNIDMEIAHDTFSDYAFKIEEGPTKGNIYENTFKGKRNITVNAQGENLKFYHNNIYKQYYYGITYSGTNPMDFRKNWWGSMRGPENIDLDGNIDYDNWALFEDFSRFKNDPYNLKDLEAACAKLGDGIESNWLYNLKKDNVIDKLDLIGITRRIGKVSS